MSERREIIPALGTRAEPGPYRRAVEHAKVALHRRRFGDSHWSYLYGRDTRYRAEAPTADRVSDAARRARRGAPPDTVQGPVIQAPVWTWEVPLYFWFGGVAAGSSLVAFASDLAGDTRSAATARRLTLAAVAPCAPLLIADLGRPARFLKMLRIFKPRSPMSMGAWALTLFGGVATAAVAADLMRRPRLARAFGGGNALVGGYFGSYTGVLLSATAVPVWARSRLFLAPIFAASATATGAAASRLILVGTGLPTGHPTREALGWVESGAIATEVALSAINHRRLGQLAPAVEDGQAGRLFRLANGAVLAGLGLRFLRRAGPFTHHLASALYLAGGLAFRYAWLAAGRRSAADHERVARNSRGFLPSA
jgi:formate-dependent nitrite reductase membrane component NrfD